jgi:PAS domain S-box-containing protein
MPPQPVHQPPYDVEAVTTDLLQALVEPAPLDDIAYLILQYAKRLTGSTFGYVGYIDPATGHLVSTTMTRDIWEDCEVPDKDYVFEQFSGLWGWVLEARQPLLTNAPQEHPHSSGVPTGHVPIRRFLSAPACIGDELLGQIALANPGRDYEEKDLQFVERLAHVYALAVQRQRMMGRIEVSEEKYRHVVENINHVIFTLDGEGAFGYVNPAIEQVTGHAPEDLMGRPFVQLVHPDDRPILEQSLERARTGHPQPAQFRVMDRSGGVHHVQLVMQALMDEGAIKQLTGFMIDITQQHEARRALRTTNARLRNILESISDGFFVLNRELVITYFNEAAERMLGRQRSEVVGRYIFEAFPEGAGSIFEEKYRLALEEERTIFFETYFGRAPYEDWYNVRVYPYRDGISVFFQITSERHAAREALQRSEARYRTLAENFPNGAILLYDPEMRVILADGARLADLGLSEVPEGQSLWESFAPEIGGALTGLCRAALKGRTQRREIPLGARTHEVRTLPVRDETGAVAAGLLVTQDVTERRRREERIKHLNAVLRAIRNVNQLIVKEKDRQRLLVGACENLVETRGYHSAAIVLTEAAGEEITVAAGQEDPFLSLVAWVNAGTWPACARAALESEEVIVVEPPLPHCDACAYGCAPPENRRALIYPLRYQDRTYGILKVSLPRDLAHDEEEHALFREVADDIAFALHGLEVEGERAQAKALLAEKVEALRHSNAELRQFAYAASHDLQEPLRMISSYLQLLERRFGTALDDRAHTYIDHAVKSAAQMRAMVHGLLNYSRLGTQPQTPVPVDTGELVQDAMENLAVVIQESGAIITMERLPTVRGEGVQLRRLFQNLLSNALKFRGERVPRIHLRAEREGAQWRFAVRDNGIGVAPEHQEEIFEIFQKLHSSAEYTGAGIGLALCKKIVEQHGGEIWLESEPGEGTTFYFTLPAVTEVA